MGTAFKDIVRPVPLQAKCGAEGPYIWVGLMLGRAVTPDFGFCLPSVNLHFHGRVFNFWSKFDWDYRYPWDTLESGSPELPVVGVCA